ncbi:MAG TPA: signal peptidase I [Candidatus Limnocylindrales bacterium]|nr:signal peptidase I [Candidatus Limnocylindrales bacterium]
MPASSQFGGELYTPSSFKEVIFALPRSILILSAVIALFPFIIYILRKKTGLKKAFVMVFRIRLHIMEYLDRRYIEKSVKEEFDRLIENKKKWNDAKNAFMVIAAIMLIVLVLTKSIFFGVVTTQSMVPVIFPKELVLVEGLSKDIKKGDIIVFKKPGYKETIIHRVYSIENDLIKTKGDNGDIDPWSIRKKDVSGKAVILFGRPVVGLKNIGFYFVPTRNPFAANDPSFKLLGNTIGTLRLYGPLIAVMLLLLIIISPQTRRKKYYGRLG